jgi:mannose-1-phosphate guanylyltransferase/mannose-6-phosphate isomerase
MLQATAARVGDAELFLPLLIVGGEDHRFFIKRQLADIGARVDAILLEPAGRNTAAAAALAALWATAKSGSLDELMLLMPSDHVVRDVGAFHRAVRAGIPAAERDGLVTFGVTPHEPNTQYGYIEMGEPAEAFDGVAHIARFVEKPDRDQAQTYLDSGRFAWNSGIFLFRASALLEEMERLLPDSLATLRRSMEAPDRDDLFVRPEPQSFAAADDISIDHGIMEKTDRGFVVPIDMQWSDVGSWAALWQISQADPAGNVRSGDTLAVDCRNTLLRNDGNGLLAAVGLEGIAVVAVRDAVFVAPMDRASEVKDLVAELTAAKRSCVDMPVKVERPWGSYEGVQQGPGFQIKLLIVDPGQRLSLQRHQHRSEHWVVVRGTAEVTVGDEVSLLEANQSTYIPAGTVHRLANPGPDPLELVEVQCGTYLGEDDIERLDDAYGRI